MSMILVRIQTIVTKMDAELSEKDLMNKIKKSFGLSQRTDFLGSV